MTPKPSYHRKSIYAGEPIRRLATLHGLDARGEGLSGTLNAVADRYLDLVESCRPELTQPEWCALCEALNGTIMDGFFSRHGGNAMALEVADACQLNGLDAKWGFDRDALVAKLQALTRAQAMAAIHVVEVFWAHTSMSTDEALALALGQKRQA